MNLTREPWFVAYERAVGTSAPLIKPRPQLPEPIEPEEFALVHDIVDASAAMAGQILKPRAIAAVTRAVLQLFGIKSSPAPEPGIGSPAAGDCAPAAGALSNLK